MIEAILDEFIPREGLENEQCKMFMEDHRADQTPSRP